MANVRFYRLGRLPNYVSEKHQGIFVHVTTGNETHKAGLWFGGANGWEYLTNDTTPESITAAIDALNAGGFTQATIGANTTEGSESATGSTLTIKGIKETRGLIEQDNANDVNIAIDGVYNESTNKIATQSTVTNVITGLNAGTIQAVTTAQATDNNANTVLTFNGVKETNGVIAQGDGASTFTVGDAKLKIQIGSSAATNVFSANATVDSTIQLDGLVFRKDENNVISVITKSAVASNNKLVTEQDIASLGGAMHYKGAITSLDNWPTTVAAGDVYISTVDRNFIYNEQKPPIEPGDMIVFNSENVTDFTVVQSNLTLGTGPGQIAKNDITLTSGNIVVATGTGIKTIGISETNLTDINDNHRHLSIGPDGPADGAFHHNVTITDALKVIGKDFRYSINISSPNRSINIINNNPANADIGVMVDLVWNTTMDSVPNN